MNRTILFTIFLSLLLVSCKNQELQVTQIKGEQLTIKDSIPANDTIEAFIAPYRDRIAEEMDSVLAIAPNHLDKSDGDLNTAIGNMMADAIMEMANPVFQKRTGKSIDVVLLNHGGIRSTISKGEVTTRTAFQVMPFENEVVVAKLSGKDIQKMIDYLVEGQTAHPIAGMQLVLNRDNSVEKAIVQGKPIEPEGTYFVATNDYLFEGGDNMNFFSAAEDPVFLDYKIRNLLIDYFKKKDTIAPVIDSRFIRTQK